jgi:hypothetical protein
MGRRSCSLRPESARGRVMMEPPVDVAGLCPRLGDVEAPPKPRSSPSPRVGRGGDCRLVPGRSPSPGVRRSGVRRLLGPSPSPSPGSGEAEIIVFWAEPKSEPWVGRGGDRRLLGPSPSPSPGSGGARRLPGLSPSPSPGSGGVRRLPGLSPSPSPGSGGAELPMVPSAGPDCLSVLLCQVAPQSEWRRRRCPSVRPVSGAAK